MYDYNRIIKKLDIHEIQAICKNQSEFANLIIREIEKGVSLLEEWHIK